MTGSKFLKADLVWQKGSLYRAMAELTSFQNLGQQGREFHTTARCEGLIIFLLKEVPWISAFMYLTACMTEDVLKSWMEHPLFHRWIRWLEMKMSDSKVCLLVKLTVVLKVLFSDDFTLTASN